jgi:hypothetical protein
VLPNTLDSNITFLMFREVAADDFLEIFFFLYLRNGKSYKKKRKKKIEEAVVVSVLGEKIKIKFFSVLLFTKRIPNSIILS